MGGAGGALTTCKVMVLEGVFLRRHLQVAGGPHGGGAGGGNSGQKKGPRGGA